MPFANINLNELLEKEGTQNITKIYESYMEASKNYLFSGLLDQESSTLQKDNNIKR